MPTKASDIAPKGNRRRVVQVVQWMGLVGGLERVAATLCETLDRARYEPFVIAMREGGFLAEHLESKGIPVLVLERDPNQRDLLSHRQIRRTLIALEADVVHSHNTEPFVQSAIACTGLRNVRLIHTDHARPFPDKLRWMIAENVASRRAARVVGVSHHTTEALRRYEKIPRRKLATIPNGIDPEPFASPITRDEARVALGLPLDVPVLGAVVARFSEQKGLDTLIDAFQLVHSTCPQAVLALVGERRGKERVMAHASRLGLEESVVFLGRRNDVPQVLRAFDLYVMSSNWEGLPLVVLEAMAAGLPVVSTDVGGVSTAVEDGETGLVVPPKNPAALSAAVLALLSDPARRARMAREARLRFEEQFTAQKMTERYESLYDGTD